MKQFVQTKKGNKADDNNSLKIFPLFYILLEFILIHGCVFITRSCVLLATLLQRFAEAYKSEKMCKVHNEQEARVKRTAKIELRVKHAISVLKSL